MQLRPKLVRRDEPQKGLSEFGEGLTVILPARQPQFLHV